MSDSEPVSNVSDSSFVILGVGSLPNQSNNEVQEENSNSNLALNSTSTDTYFDLVRSSTDESRCSLSEGSIQEKLNELVKENYQLKETLSQNNLAIKSQLDTFFMWQQEVLKTHETHKQKFLETKDLILKLRSENLSLKKQLEEYLNGFSIVNSAEYSSHANKNFDSTEENVEKENISELPEKKDTSLIPTSELAKELENAKKEISELKINLSEVVTENAFLKNKIENFGKNSDKSLSYKSLPNTEARTQISNLFKQLEEEKTKVLKLKDELKKNELSNQGAFNSNMTKTDELNNYISKLNDMNHSLDRQNERLSGFYSWVALAEENLKENHSNKAENNLMCEIKEFRNMLNVEENVFKEKQESLQELREQFTRLLKDYKILQEQLDILSSENKNAEKNEERITNLLAELKVKDGELTVKQEECNSLKEELKKLDAEWSERVAVLEIQLEVYKTDFNCEREAREKIVGEKEQMAEQIRLLQNQISNFERSNSQESDHHESSPLESPGKRTTYVCPKCMFSFYSLKRCEEHIDECLNIHMYP